MILYLIRESNPESGYLSAQDWMPDLSSGRMANYVEEVRVIKDFPEEIFQFATSDGGLPTDPSGTGHDLVWLPWWTDAEVVFRKD